MIFEDIKKFWKKSSEILKSYMYDMIKIFKKVKVGIF